MKAAFFFAGLLCLIATSGLAAEPAQDSHCTDGEQIVFSCTLGNKIVSVCASADFPAQGSLLQYRFGKPEAVELILPRPLPQSNATTSVARIQGRALMFAGGGGGYLRFIDPPYHHIVYSAIGKGWGAKDGVALEKNRRTIAYRECRDVPVSHFNDAFFSGSRITPDAHEFDIPGTD